MSSTSSSSYSNQVLTDEKITDKELCSGIIDETVDKALTLKGKEAKEYVNKLSEVLTTKIHGDEILILCAKTVSGDEIERLNTAIRLLRSNY